MPDETWKDKYRTCRVCGKELSPEKFEWAAARFERATCSTECYKDEIKARHACCMDAEFSPCVCMYSFTCKTHGETHVGTHD